MTASSIAGRLRTHRADPSRHGRRRPAIHDFSSCRKQSRGWPAFGDVIQLALTHRKRNDRRNIMLEWYQAEYRFVRTASCAWFRHMLHIRTTSTNWITTPFAGHDGMVPAKDRA